ncbi:MAG: N-acetyl-gamma-glutamyl-phosphate reductase [Gammaproteobacteria bacterium]|nr:N-acetyl-gamma-glutamyl-phosphate reductase [Gammaproteobacteria bacterium]
MSNSVPTAVLGATGYVGGELLRLISQHPELHFAAAVSNSYAGRSIASVFSHLASAYRDTKFVAHDDWIENVDTGSDLALFSAAPHGASANLIRAALAAAASKDLNVHVVDSSADFRYREPIDYRTVYGVDHGAPDLLSSFHCGVPEHVSDTTAPHIGHPGCFATAVLLAAVPLLSSGFVEGDLFVSGVTGSTGSGRKPQEGTHHPERHSNMYAYKPLEHRHAPEIMALAKQALGIDTIVNFVPHSGPFARGIYVTVQAKAASGTSSDALRTTFVEAYRDAPFIDVVDGTPRLKSVIASNRCQIGIATSPNAIVITSAIDNLVKGAAGGAVQWMNRLWGFPETSGLLAPATAWT